MDSSTIAAIATPSGRGGIGIIKLSGPEAVSITRGIFRPAVSESAFNSQMPAVRKRASSGCFQSHRLYYGHIIDPENQQILDEVLLSIMKAPLSYTKEDVVEINAHGGIVAVNAILELVLKYGARLAEPGEFTKRAFLNGRIDLTQAEAVIDIIGARTDKSLQVAAAQIRGNMKRQVESIRECLVALLTHVEAAIDFPDDVEDIIDADGAVEKIESKVAEPLRRLIQHHLKGYVLRDGLKVAIVGRPNVGKSSLLNRLVQKDRAIVTGVPGTTRDTIEETFNISGIPIIISDTAGLRETIDPIETVSIEKTLENVNGADLVLFMIEANCPLTGEDRKIFEKIQLKPFIIVINKIDLVEGDNFLELPDSWAQIASVRISALYDRGIDHLKHRIFEAAFGKDPIDLEGAIIPNIRQKLLLEDSLRSTETIIHEINNSTPIELIAIHLRDAIDTLGEILGTTVKIDVIDRIFSQFCIGK